MTKTFISRFLISLFVFVFTSPLAFANELKFVSTAPALTEIMYAIGAGNQLYGVSTSCNYPSQVKQKDVIGDAYFINKEKILKLRPNYILAVSKSQESSALAKIGIKTVYFDMNSVESIYNAIKQLGEMTGKQQNAELLVQKLSSDILKTKPAKQKRILFLAQVNPAVTIGKKSFLSDVIKKSGQISVTDDINQYYPPVADEYLLKTKPDVIVVIFKTDETKLRKLFPNAKIRYMTPIEADYVNRPGARVNQSVKFFADL